MQAHAHNKWYSSRCGTTKQTIAVLVCYITYLFITILCGFDKRGFFRSSLNMIISLWPSVWAVHVNASVFINLSNCMSRPQGHARRREADALKSSLRFPKFIWTSVTAAWAGAGANSDPSGYTEQTNKQTMLRRKKKYNVSTAAVILNIARLRFGF